MLFKPSDKISARSSMVLVERFKIRFASGDKTWHWFNHWNAWRQTGWKVLFGSNGGGNGGGLFIILFIDLWLYASWKKKKKRKTLSKHSIVFFHIHLFIKLTNQNRVSNHFESNKKKEKEFCKQTKKNSNFV